MKHVRLGPYWIDVILLWVDFSCRYYIILWQDDDGGDKEGDHARRHLCSCKNKLINQKRQRDTKLWQQLEIKITLKSPYLQALWRKKKKNMYYLSRRHEDNNRKNDLTLSYHHAVYVINVMSRLVKVSCQDVYESSFSTSFVDYVISIYHKCNEKWKSKSHL